MKIVAEKQRNLNRRVRFVFIVNFFDGPRIFLLFKNDKVKTCGYFYSLKPKAFIFVVV